MSAAEERSLADRSTIERPARVEWDYGARVPSDRRWATESGPVVA
jgi:hypothetical protein